MIEWFNSNEGLMAAALSFVGIFLSGIAIYISIKVSQTQNKIALFDMKFQTYKALENYFDSTKGWPKEIMKFLGSRNIFLTDSVWDPEINEIIGKAILLFSTDLCEKLQEIKKNYTEIRHIDGKIGSYFSRLEEYPDYFDIKKSFVEYLETDNPKNDEETEFEEFCNKYIISTDELIDMREYETVEYNFYDLYKKQSELECKIFELKKDILESMQREIRPV